MDAPAAYIGVMGSRRRWEETKRLLLADGAPADKLSRVVSPIGLELNAESPAEIAVSIMAQIIMIQRGGDGRPMDTNRAPATGRQPTPTGSSDLDVLSRLEPS